MQKINYAPQKKVAITYVIVGVLLAIIGGILIGKLKLEKYVQDYVFNMKVGETQEAVKDLGIEATIEKVEDMAKIMEYGVMRTPALVVDEKVAVQGRIPIICGEKEKDNKK